MRVQTRAIRMMGRACRGGHLPAMRRGDLDAGREGHSRRSAINVRGRQLRSIYAPPSFGCATEVGSTAQLNTILMEDDPRGRGRDFINRGNTGVTMFIWAGFGVLMPPWCWHIPALVRFTLALVWLPSLFTPLPVSCILIQLCIALLTWSGLDSGCWVVATPTVEVHRALQPRRRPFPTVIALTVAATAIALIWEVLALSGTTNIWRQAHLGLRLRLSSALLSLPSIAPWIVPGLMPTSLFFSLMKPRMRAVLVLLKNSLHRSTLPKPLNCPRRIRGRPRNCHTFRRIRRRTRRSPKWPRWKRAKLRKRKNMDGAQLWRRCRKTSLLQGLRSCCSGGILVFPFFLVISMCPSVSGMSSCRIFFVLMCQCGKMPTLWRKVGFSYAWVSILSSPAWEWFYWSRPPLWGNEQVNPLFLLHLVVLGCQTFRQLDLSDNMIVNVIWFCI